MSKRLVTGNDAVITIITVITASKSAVSYIQSHPKFSLGWLRGQGSSFSQCGYHGYGLIIAVTVTSRTGDG